MVPPCEAVYTGKAGRGSPAVDPPDSGDYVDHLWWDGDKEADRIWRRNVSLHTALTLLVCCANMLA